MRCFDAAFAHKHKLICIVEIFKLVLSARKYSRKLARLVHEPRLSTGFAEMRHDTQHDNKKNGRENEFFVMIRLAVQC